MVPEKALKRQDAVCRALPARLLLVFFVAATTAGCVSSPSQPAVPAGQREFRVPAVDELLYGTWVAAGASATVPAKVRLFSWGLAEGFADLADREPRWTGTSFIVDVRAGEEGEHWYREFRRWAGEGPADAAPFVLDRVSSDGLTLESISSAAGWPSPSQMSASNPTYTTYMRQGPVP